MDGYDGDILRPRENPKIDWRVDPDINGISEVRSFRVLTWTEYSDRYKLYLPRNFFCGLVFFELQKDDEYSAAILDHSLDGILKNS